MSLEALLAKVDGYFEELYDIYKGVSTKKFVGEDDAQSSGEVSKIKNLTKQLQSKGIKDLNEEAVETVDTLEKSNPDTNKNSEQQQSILCENAATQVNDDDDYNASMRHKRSKKQVLRFKCDQCDFKAKHRGSLVYHNKRKHQSTGSKCDYQFTQKDNLKTHQDSFHV